MTEFNLSKKERIQFIHGIGLNLHYFKVSDVKEFIRLLKEIEITKLRTFEYLDIIDEIAGDALK